jgi:uncharacterized membrane protein YkvA (DUF1232 family)
MSHKEEFVEFLARSINELQQDVKILFEMLDDAEFNDNIRTRVAGALLYLLAPGDLVPDSFGALGHADDSLVLRMSMAATLRSNEERAGHYRDRYPEVFETMDRDLEVARAYLGDIYPWLEDWLEKLEALEYKGKRASVFVEEVEEGSWLYDEINEAMLDLEFDDDELSRELRRIDRILPVLREKMEVSRR